MAGVEEVGAAEDELEDSTGVMTVDDEEDNDLTGVGVVVEALITPAC